MYTICEGPKLDAYMFHNVMPTNYQYDSIYEDK